VAVDDVKRALVIGCSASVWADVDAALKLFTPDTVYCVKLAGVSWNGGRFVWVGLHPEFMDGYKRERSALGLASDYETVGPLAKEVKKHARHELDRRVSYLWPGVSQSASSGIYGAKVALDDGHDRVVLAGIPMDTSKHFSRGKPWLHCDLFMKGFKKSVPHLLGKVKSMSGTTKEVLGFPSPEWLDGKS
jgi:hypothetical protein